MDIKTADTRDMIIQASKEVFRSLGYNKVTMANIADATQMGRSSLYYYFKNKLEVFEAIAYEVFKDILDVSKKEIKQSQSFHENFLKFNAKRLDLIIEQTTLYHTLLLDIRENPNVLTKVKKETLSIEVEIFHQILVWAIEKKDIAQLSPDDLAFLSTNILYAFRGLEQELFFYGKVEELTSRLSWVTSILCKGLQ